MVKILKESEVMALVHQMVAGASEKELKMDYRAASVSSGAWKMVTQVQEYQMVAVDLY